MADDTPVTKIELISRMDAGRESVRKLLATHTEAQLTDVRDSAGWSAKDHVAHLACWAFGIADLLLKRPRWLAMGIDFETWAASTGAESINGLLLEPDRDRSLAEVVTLFESAHERVASAVRRLPTDADLMRNYTCFQPTDPREGNDPIVGWIVGDAHGHYAEHIEWMTAWLPAR